MTIVLDLEWTAAIGPDDPRYAAIDHEAAKRKVSPEEYQAICCPPLCSVVAAGLLNTVTQQIRLGYDAARLDVPMLDPVDERIIAAGNEAGLLSWVNMTLDAFCPPALGPRLATFNGMSADLPVLWHRSMVLGVTPARAVRRWLGAKPWETGPHLDLCNALRMNGQRFGLRTYALAYGLPDPKALGSGATVAELVAKRDGPSILRYLEGDVTTTAALAERLAAMLP